MKQRTAPSRITVRSREYPELPVKIIYIGVCILSRKDTVIAHCRRSYGILLTLAVKCKFNFCALANISIASIYKCLFSERNFHSIRYDIKIYRNVLTIGSCLNIRENNVLIIIYLCIYRCMIICSPVIKRCLPVRSSSYYSAAKYMHIIACQIKNLLCTKCSVVYSYIVITSFKICIAFIH